MERRYPKFTNEYLVYLQMVGGVGMTMGLYFSTPMNWGMPGKLLMASGGLMFCCYAIDVWLDFKKHHKPQ